MEYITDWRTSTRTQGQGRCVEIGFGADRVAIRDTKDRAAGHLAVRSKRWSEFVRGIKRGEFDV
ncbi:DUF397 domain-containing protein [Saccharopolyspora sp. K220]|uniref:DUF397 domain-containing protein n=1 Tax=Saccharopolyspora soli TaxID=2926618 RepID=UPI001F58D3B8|nr:DUF397 domain-containing protein [Saccharopolyspora soli]MCI2423437.1 DUF397 domain-containing protein [Saccharopolyspora soli]